MSLSVSAGTVPTFSWVPACRVEAISVDPYSDMYVYWVVQTVGDTNGIAPPVRYGVTPPAAESYATPPALKHDSTYRVHLQLYTGNPLSLTEIIATASFRP